MLSLLIKLLGFVLDWAKLSRKGVEYAKRQKSRDDLYDDPDCWFADHFAGGMRDDAAKPDDKTDEADNRYSAP
jgi:hypothetical protein